MGLGGGGEGLRLGGLLKSWLGWFGSWFGGMEAYR